MGQFGYNSYSTDSVWDLIDEFSDDGVCEPQTATQEQVESMIALACKKLDEYCGDGGEMMIPHYEYTKTGIISWAVSNGFKVEINLLKDCCDKLQSELDNRDDYDAERKQVVADEIEVIKNAISSL